MTLEENVIKKYYQKYYNLNVKDNALKKLPEYNLLRFYPNLRFKRKIDYLYYYLNNNDLKSFWNGLCIGQKYNELIFKSLNALLAYYKNKYPLIYNKNSEDIANLIINEDILKLLKKDISKIKKMYCSFEAMHDSYMQINEIYSCSKDVIIVNESEYDRLEQNHSSLKLPFKQLFYPDSRTNFYLTFFNFFQDLSCHQKYESFSQAATTYYLKQLAKINKIKILSLEKDLKINLNRYYEPFHNTANKDIQMYNVVFDKVASFNYNDLTYLYTIFKSLSIDVNSLKYYFKEDKIYFKTNMQYKFQALKNKNINDIKLSLAIILEILFNMKADFTETYQENKKIRYLDASLQRQLQINSEIIK